MSGGSKTKCVPWRAARAALIAPFAVIALAGAAGAAESGAAATLSSGKLAGVFSGLLITAFVAYALFLYTKPLLERRDRGLLWAAIILFGIWVVKTAALPVFPGFNVDVGTYEAWALKIATDGPARLYTPGYFIDYPPGYLYPLWLAGWFAQATDASGLARRMIVEMPALVADFLLAMFMFVFVRRTRRGALAYGVMLLVALNPALLFDTMVWGQTDSVMTFVLLLATAMMLEGEYEVGWGLTALALLIKPQALTLVPVFGLWLLFKCDYRKWWRSALACVAMIVVGVAPFQIDHPWLWLPELYHATAAYYHETSVNAFNLIALVGGIRQSDSGTILGISYFNFGMALLVPLYAFVAWVLWRHPTRRNLLFTCFMALFGFFMLAPRMHERYLYPAVAFVIPLALEEPVMLGLFALLSITCLINLAYVLHTLQTTVFMDASDPVAMGTALINLIGLAIAAGYGYARAGVADIDVKTGEGLENWMGTALRGTRVNFKPGPPPIDTYRALPWLTTDTIVLVVLVAVAAALRFWNIGHPHEIVFDEVHFVGQARHYLHAEPFLDPHPPIDKLIIALGIMVFGDHSSSWRVGNAMLGTIMAGVTYLLGRRMFRSRLAATLAAAFVLCDGFFIVDSRIACIDIAYLTFAAIAYLFLFRFMQSDDPAERRRTLLYTGIALGLCLGSKLYVPGITFLLVGGFVVFTLWRPEPLRAALSNDERSRRLLGAVLLLGSVSAFFYLAAFLPKYYLGWWGGIEDLFHYYKEVMWYENSVVGATHPYASPWWSWPLMMRPVAYWQNFPAKGPVATIWGAGNPLTWWAVIPAMTITAVRALERPNVTRTFLVIGYLAYFVIWIPIVRILFLYHYMPSVYIGYLALGAVMADLWRGEAEVWESFAMLIPLLFVFIFGIGHGAVIYGPAWVPKAVLEGAGLPLVIIFTVAYLVLMRKPLWLNRFVFISFVAVAAAMFVYYLPVWIGTPIPRMGYYARMWFEGPGLHNWI
ncbi:MAG: phospholipid carrier-dependent glycosyltransferase [Candidatus Binataceae bacterium]